MSSGFGALASFSPGQMNSLSRGGNVDHLQSFKNATTYEWSSMEALRCAKTIWSIIEFSRWGPTLYESNQPLSIRRSWHFHCIDTVLTDVGLPVLPRVLTDLVGEYSMINIPFIPEEAETQMSSLPLVPLSECHYDGQRLNGAESVDLNQSGGHTLRWESTWNELIEFNVWHSIRTGWIES
jgi:hypothetical protein